MLSASLAWSLLLRTPKNPQPTALSVCRKLARCCPAGFSGSLSMSRSEEHTSELQSLMRISYAVFCLKKKKNILKKQKAHHTHIHDHSYKPSNTTSCEPASKI